jgi:ATP-dependent Clp protease, protease subunit
VLAYDAGKGKWKMAEYHMLFSAPINAAVSNAFITQLGNLIAQRATKLTIAINSPGGDVALGTAMYNTMLAMPFPIVAHNIGNVDSIANIVFLGAGERYACSAATFMFHGVGFDGNANERLDEKRLQEKLDIVINSHKRLSNVIASRTATVSVRQGMQLFKEQRTRDSTWAKANGFISDIKDFVLPAGSNILYFVQ